MKLLYTFLIFVLVSVEAKSYRKQRKLKNNQSWKNKQLKSLPDETSKELSKCYYETCYDHHFVAKNVKCGECIETCQVNGNYSSLEKIYGNCANGECNKVCHTSNKVQKAFDRCHKRCDWAALNKNPIRSLSFVKADVSTNGRKMRKKWNRKRNDRKRSRHQRKNRRRNKNRQNHKIHRQNKKQTRLQNLNCYAEKCWPLLPFTCSKCKKSCLEELDDKPWKMFKCKKHNKCNEECSFDTQERKLEFENCKKECKKENSVEDETSTESARRVVVG